MGLNNDKSSWDSSYMEEDKKIIVLNLMKKIQDKRKATVHELQRFIGHHNYLNGVSPQVGCVKFTGDLIAKLKLHHRVWLDKDFKDNCRMWQIFLEDDGSLWTLIFLEDDGSLWTLTKETLAWFPIFWTDKIP